MLKPVLSKSSYIRGLQCHKSLYLYKKNYKLRDYLSPEQLAKFKRGTDVGILAQQLFPGGKTAASGSYHHPYKNVEKTSQLISSGCNVIYEAAFIYNEVYIAIDIMVRQNENLWIAYEVKSSSQLSETYYKDAALQYYVISNSGVNLSDFKLIHINNSYVKKSRLELQELFAEVSVVDYCKSNLAAVETNINELKAMLEQLSVPDIDIGMHCTTPYPCDFSGYCRKHIPLSGTVFQLTDSTAEAHYELYKKGIINITDIPADMQISTKQKIQLKAEEFCDKENICNLIKSTEQNDIYIDLLSFSPAVPLFENTSPYQSIPFLFSFIETDSLGNEIKHLQYFSEPGTESRIELFNLYLKVLETKNRIFVYNRPYISEILSENNSLLPSNFISIENNIEIIDIKIIFDEMYYFNPITGFANDSVFLANKLNAKRGNKAVFPSEIIAAQTYQSMFYSNDIFETIDAKENLLKYSMQKLIASRDLVQFLRTKSGC